MLLPDLSEVAEEAGAEGRATSNRSAIWVARHTRWPHPAVHVFGRLKGHSFCFLL